MKVFYFLCVLPLIFASPRGRDSADDSHEVGDWENGRERDVFGRRNEERNGVVRLVARISTNGRERRENRWSPSEKWDESGEKREEDMHRRHYRQRPEDRMMRHHDHKKQAYDYEDSSDEKDYRREKRGGMRHGHGGDSNEYGGEREELHEWRRPHGDRPEWRNRMDRSNNDGSHGQGRRHGGHIREENDNHNRQHYRGDHHRENGGEDYRGQWMENDKYGPRDRNHRDSSEEDLRREYVRFFGRLSFNNHQDDNMRAENHRRRDQTRGSERHSYGNHKMNRHDDEENMKMDETDEDSAREIEKRLKMTMEELYKKDQYELAKVLTLSFLKMCECDSDDATDLLKSFIARAERPENGTRVLELPNVPDFKGNTTARVEFYRSLTEEQMSLLFGHDLVKSMCTGAKMFLVQAKTFFDKYFPSYHGFIPSTNANDIKATAQQG